MGKHVVLTFDDACVSHLTVAMPELLKRQFGATFFICRFSDEWQKVNEKHLLDTAGVKKLSEAGFDIGKHTWNHRMLNTLPDSEIRSEISRLRDFLRAENIPDATSFAYPRGPYAGNAVPIIRKFGFRMARIVDHGELYIPGLTDPMRVPALGCVVNRCVLYYANVKKEAIRDDECIRAARYFG